MFQTSSSCKSILITPPFISYSLPHDGLGHFKIPSVIWRLQVTEWSFYKKASFSIKVSISGRFSEFISWGKRGSTSVHLRSSFNVWFKAAKSNF